MVVGMLVKNSVSGANCPLYWQMQSIRDENNKNYIGGGGAVVSFNYTHDMINNWDSYSCDSVPNALFNGDFAITNGAALVDFQYNLVMMDSSSSIMESYCNFVNVKNPFIRNQTLELFEMFNNSTLMKQHFVPYLESLLIEKKFEIERIYFIEGFDIILENGQTKAKLFELVNAFNYFLFCKESNPHFEQFHTKTLPSIAQLSSYSRVETLDVLFGRNLEETCGVSTIPFFNRTLQCHCSPTITNSTSIQFTILSHFECSSIYVKFWVPLSSHPSLKIIEVLLHLFQILIISLLCFIPIITRNIKKWKDHLIARQNISIIQKSNKKKKKQEISPPPTVQNSLEIEKLQVFSMTPLSVNNENVVVVNEIVNEVNVTNDNLKNVENSTLNVSFTNSILIRDLVSNENDRESPKIENLEMPLEKQVRNSMKEHLQHELLRIICDMKLLTVVSLLMGIFCLFMNALLHVSSSGLNGTAVYPSTTFLIASLAFICVYNIPLSGSFVEVLLKLDGNNKRVSIHGLIILFGASILLIILIVACIVAAFTARLISGYIRVLSMPIALIVLIISWSIIFSYSLKIYFMLKKKRRIYFLQFKFSQYLILILLALIYMIYEVLSEFGFITELYVWESLWTVMFKHRIASYIMGGVFWGGAYVLFSGEHLEECYRPLMKKLGILEWKKKRNHDSNKNFKV